MKSHLAQTSPSTPPALTRRRFLASSLTAAVGASLAPAATAATAAPRDWSGLQPVRYPDVDIIVLDPRFEKYKLGNTAIQRLHTGSLWAEGPAWSGVGKYFLWSDIPNNCQMRWLNDDGHVSVFRQPSGQSNGNTFDFSGRQISCEHAGRRVVRYELDGSLTVLADKFNGKPFNAPNDAVVHPDGGIWFTDPGYGSMVNYEGNKGPLEIKEATYRIDSKTGQVALVTDSHYKPNGLCFSPDYKKLYIVDTGGPTRQGISVYDVVDSVKLANPRKFCSMELRGLEGGSDGVRCDVDGNVWASAAWVGDGYDGVHVFAPDGQRIGMILLPETCSNLCFGGPKRNRLFITASQSIYSVYVETQGAHIT